MDSHRGWDAGALQLGRQMADAFGVPLHAATTTRLLVDLNRSIGHRQLFSEVTRPLPPARRQEIVDRYYRPHREAVEGEIARHIASGQRVIHIASHSFTPTLDGVVARRADVAWLYDPRRSGEVAFARAWMMQLTQRAPELRLRRNYPYQGRGDGLTALLRKRHPDDDLRGDRARGEPAHRRTGRRAVVRGAGEAHRIAGEDACWRLGRLGVLSAVWRPRPTTGAAASSWKTLRVPSSHCCVSASK